MVSEDGLSSGHFRPLAWWFPRDHDDSFKRCFTRVGFPELSVLQHARSADACVRPS